MIGDAVGLPMWVDLSPRFEPWRDSHTTGIERPQLDMYPCSILNLCGLLATCGLLETCIVLRLGVRSG